MISLEEVLAQGKKTLQEAQIEDAGLDAWYLFEHVFGMARAEYFLHLKKEADGNQLTKYCELISLREKHYPLQYLIGSTEFMGLTFMVNENVLIPRQDTECLVEEMLKVCEGKEVLDVCTGSGCIIVSLAKLSSLKRAAATDISGGALQVAEKNAKYHGVNIDFIQGDLFENVEGMYDIIVSNPPYIESSVIDTLMEEVREYEPRLALDGTEDGLYFYQKIICEATKFLKPCGTLFFEIGYNQGNKVKTLLEENHFNNIEIKKDLAGLDRVVIGRL